MDARILSILSSSFMPVYDLLLVCTSCNPRLLVIQEDLPALNPPS